MIVGVFADALSLVAMLVGIAVVADRLLAPDRKDALALWLMGAGSRADSTHFFLSLFDSVYSENPLSLRFISRSCIVSLVNVLVLYAIIAPELSVGRILVLCVTINFIVDYISAAQTRYFIVRIARLRRDSLVAIAFLAETISSSAIFLIYASSFFAIFPDMRALIFLEAGAPAIAIFFLSTVFTSLWSWTFFIAGQIQRAMVKLDFSKHFDLERSPTTIFSIVFSVVAVAFGVVATWFGTPSVAEYGLTALLQAALFIPDSLDTTTPSREHVVGALAGFLCFLLLSHSAISQTASLYMRNLSATGPWSAAAIFSFLSVGVIVIKVLSPSLLSGVMAGNQAETTALLLLLDPAEIPRWQLASFVNSMIFFSLLFASQRVGPLYQRPHLLTRL